jgi:adenine C2-methylase RlmN of 23S rRNA A2503 and tRNA A37
LPWLRGLEERQHVLVDEVLARFLERKVSKQLHTFTESFEEQLQEMRMHSPLRNLDWTVGFYSRIYEDFGEHTSPRAKASKHSLRKY